jgi:hypothetical protein
MSGETLHPVRSDQHDERTDGGHMGPDLAEPLHSPVKRTVFKEHIFGAEPLLEPEVKRPCSARHLGMAVTNEDLSGCSVGRSTGTPAISYKSLTPHAPPLHL